MPPAPEFDRKRFATRLAGKKSTTKNVFSALGMWLCANIHANSSTWPTRAKTNASVGDLSFKRRISSLTKKAEPPPTHGVNRDSGNASANGGWLRRLVRQQRAE